MVRYTEEQVEKVKVEVRIGREAIDRGEPCPICKAEWIADDDTFGHETRSGFFMMHDDDCPLWNLEECPVHGEVPIDPLARPAATKGPDPYSITTLICGHRVACFGPHEGNVIV
jgi:hypothetical protein